MALKLLPNFQKTVLFWQHLLNLAILIESRPNRRRLGLVCGGRTEAVQTANKNIFFTWQSRKDYLFVIAS